MRLAARLALGAFASLLLAGVQPARAEPLTAFEPAARGTGFAESFDRALRSQSVPTIALLPASAYFSESGDTGATVETESKPHTFWIAVISAATAAGSAYNSFGDGPSEKWHFTNEGWLGQYTYAGGGDKASHIVSFYMVAKLLGGVYEELGMKRDSAALLAAGVSTFAGFVTELGDGRGRYGFSYEDLVTDTIGAATFLAISHYHLEDLLSLSGGIVPIPDYPCCYDGAFGKDYTQEIYAANLKIDGLARRMHFRPGPARFLLFSVSYSAKGYPYADPVIRERQIGFSVGINFGQVMKEIGVPQEVWWGKILYFLFDVLRIPYTQIGMYYDLNNGNWYGPGIGDQWFTGSPGTASAAGLRIRR